MKAIKYCPFCGKEAKTFFRDICGTKMDGAEWLD